MHYLYKIINKLNDKVYIGQTTDNNRRWGQHKRYSRYPEQTGQYIHRAMAKYGISNFEFEIIASCKTQEYADEIESILIIQYDSINKEKGYNLSVGGIGETRGIVSEETKEKIRQATFRQIAEKGHPAQGHKWTEEQKNKLSNSLKALDKTLIYTDEVRKNMSEAHIGKIIPEEQRQKMSESIQANWDQRNAQRLASGELKCNVPGCEQNGLDIKYLIVDNIRYCSLHGQRLRKHGSVDIILPSQKYSSENPMPEEIRKKCGIANIGKIPHNKIKFTNEQIQQILSDPRGARKVGPDFGVSANTVTRIRKEFKM